MSRHLDARSHAPDLGTLCYTIWGRPPLETLWLQRGNLMSGLNSTRLLTGLLQHNYFPAHKADMTEIPPILTSLGLSATLAAKITANCGCRKGYGYDAVEYRAARFDGVYRPLHIPHPVPYSELALCIAENWSKSHRWPRIRTVE